MFSQTSQATQTVQAATLGLFHYCIYRYGNLIATAFLASTLRHCGIAVVMHTQRYCKSASKTSQRMHVRTIFNNENKDPIFNTPWTRNATGKKSLTG